MTEKPTYRGGEPTNLQAAALASPGHFVDALDWLRVLQGRPKDPRIKDAVWEENLSRLRLAIQALEKYLPDQEPVELAEAA